MPVMSISSNYPHPVTVNGYTCKNCTDVDYAKKHIDPQHPKSGPYGVTAATDPSVRFGGNLGHLNNQTIRPASVNPLAPGQALNITT